MPQICGEGREPRLDVDAVAVPAQQRVHGLRVREVMQPRRKLSVGADPGVLAETSECGLGCARVESCSAQRHEEARVAWVRAELVAPARVALERIQDRRVQGYVARLVELRFADEQNALGPVDVGAVELDRLADPHAGRGEQPDQRLVSHGDQQLANSFPCLRHQRQDLGVGVDERRPPLLAKPDQPGGRDLGPWVDPGHVPREAPDDQQPHPRHHAPRRHLRLERPGQRQLDRDVFGADRVEVSGEAPPQTRVIMELVAKRPTQPQVILDVLNEAGHRAAPGHDPAACRSRIRSTFA
jgi:hypothetical protein